MGKERSGYSRRDFLKVVGAGSGLAVSGCGRDLPEKLIPYVVQPDEVVPGVASWYAGNCGECSSGCGWVVRVRDGRATKPEGNPNHPVNRGGLCALGQSSIQSHYDPDRVREPLTREITGPFKTTNWSDAVGAISTAISDSAAEKDTVLITQPLTGSIQPLISEFWKKFQKFSHIEFEPLSKDIVNEAAARTFARGITTHFDFSKAQMILSVGADYLETWISPVEFSRQWAENRKPTVENGTTKMSYAVHVEPRFSPTAGSVDKWVMNRPGSEAYLLAVILKLILSKKNGQVPDYLASTLKAELASFSLENIESITGIAALGVTDLVERLLEVETSLVVAGGSACSAPFPVECGVLANLINAALGNVGKSVILRDAPVNKKPASVELHELAEAVLSGKKKLGVVVISGANLIYDLPPGSNVHKALAKADMVVAVSSQLDETANFSQYVLPLSTNFESWTDSEPAPGVFNLNQPAMSPLYQSQSLGDSLMAIGLKLNLSFAGAKNFEEFMKKQWKLRVGDIDFATRWDTYVEKGGDWSQAKFVSSKSITFSAKEQIDFKKIVGEKVEGLKLMAFPTTLLTDGRAANRAWMHEIPYPITTSVWGSWVEIHPNTAARYGIGRLDVVKVSTAFGDVQAPVYYSTRIHPELIALPLGLGHDAYGRYAAGVGANVIRTLSPDISSGTVGYLTPLASEKEGTDDRTQFESKFAPLQVALNSEKLVVLSGNRNEPVDSQLGRGLIRSVPLAMLKGRNGSLKEVHLGNREGGNREGGHSEGGHGGHEKHEAGEHGKGEHHDPFALGPQSSPVQMYEQMDHPLYRWGMTIDLNACTGCSACVVACYAENNIAVVGKEICNQGREMSWLRMERYFDGDENQPLSGFLPMLCQHCNNAPCEPVCPVYATYHNEEGINSMVYNRCVGTRYCSNNCSYKVRRFNWFTYDWPEPLTWQLNPDVTVRTTGIMEKCNFCHQRIVEAKNQAKNEGRTVREGEVVTACQSTCPTGAIRFGNLLDKDSAVSIDAQSERSYKVLDQFINTQPAVTYLAKVKHSGRAVEFASAVFAGENVNRGEG